MPCWRLYVSRSDGRADRRASLEDGRCGCPNRMVFSDEAQGPGQLPARPGCDTPRRGSVNRVAGEGRACMILGRGFRGSCGRARTAWVYRDRVRTLHLGWAYWSRGGRKNASQDGKSVLHRILRVEARSDSTEEEDGGPLRETE